MILADTALPIVVATRPVIRSTRFLGVVVTINPQLESRSEHGVEFLGGEVHCGQAKRVRCVS
jgi:hypothetical protein